MFRIIVIAVFITLTTSTASATPTLDRFPIWKIEVNGVTSYLIGTHHRVKLKVADIQGLEKILDSVRFSITESAWDQKIQREEISTLMSPTRPKVALSRKAYRRLREAISWLETQGWSTPAIEELRFQFYHFYPGASWTTIWPQLRTANQAERFGKVESLDAQLHKALRNRNIPEIGLDSPLILQQLGAQALTPADVSAAAVALLDESGRVKDPALFLPERDRPEYHFRRAREVYSSPFYDETEFEEALEQLPTPLAIASRKTRLVMTARHLDRKWTDKIESHIRTTPTLIYVGAAHVLDTGIPGRELRPGLATLLSQNAKVTKIFLPVDPPLCASIVTDR